MPWLILFTRSSRLLALAFFLLAQAPLAMAATERCDQSLPQLLNCLNERSPARLRSLSRATESEMLRQVAGEKKPIDLTVQALRDESKSTAGDSVQATGMIGLDLVGLRRARQDAASWEAEDRHLQAEIERQSVMFNGYLSLVRIQLLRKEIRLLQETEKSLEKNLIEYKKRPQLSPEQEASKTLFFLALQSLRQQRILSEQEEHSLVHDWEIQIHESFSPSESNLPKIPVQWPNLSSSQRSENAAEVRHISILKNKLEAQAHLSVTEKRPLLQLGPTFEWNRISGTEGFRYGLTLQAPLTLLSDFSGTAELAHRSFERAALEAETKRRETLGDLEHTKDVYASSVQALKSSEPTEQTWARLAALNRQFLRGLVSGASLVEIMRQATSGMQTQHQLVLRAVSTFCKIKIAEARAEECWR